MIGYNAMRSPNLKKLGLDQQLNNLGNINEFCTALIDNGFSGKHSQYVIISIKNHSQLALNDTKCLPVRLTRAPKKQGLQSQLNNGH